MKGLLIATMLMVGSPALARSTAQPKGAPPVQGEDIERRLGNLSRARFTPAFEPSYAEIVGLIKTLYGQSGPGDKVDAQDLAVSAFHAYCDHHRIDLGGDVTTRSARAREAAARAGLLQLLGW
jgi:hypothetical protein